MKFHVLTLFPDQIRAGLNDSIIKRALDKEIISLDTVNIRDFSEDKHNRVDDYTYGGGAGMLMQAEPVYRAIRSVAPSTEERDQNAGTQENPTAKRQRVIYVTPQGRPFTQEMAKDFAGEEELTILCGHYEGIDERVLTKCVTDYVSIGDYVLTGGELAAMVMIDAISRLIPGVLHNDESAETESFHADLLEYPQYSRPEVWQGQAVPEVLLSGNTRQIRAWRREESIARTKERRPDLYRIYEEKQGIKEALSKHKIQHIDMIEQINRGRCEVIYSDETEALLREKVSGTYFFTTYETAEEESYRPHFLDVLPENEKNEIQLLMNHRANCLEALTASLCLHVDYKNHVSALTRREKLPIRGLYKEDGKEGESGIAIRPMTLEDLNFAEGLYQLKFDDPDYLKHRILHDPMYLALYRGKPAGMIGQHVDGSSGMLEVLPDYRRKHIGFALETYLFNKMIEQGQIPYGYIFYTNEVSKEMQKHLGLYTSEENSFWLHR